MDAIAQAKAAGLPAAEIAKLRHFHPRSHRDLAVGRAIRERDERVKAEHADAHARQEQERQARERKAMEQAKADREAGAAVTDVVADETFKSYGGALTGAVAREHVEADRRDYPDAAARVDREAAAKRSEASRKAAATRKANADAKLQAEREAAERKRALDAMREQANEEAAERRRAGARKAAETRKAKKATEPVA